MMKAFRGFGALALIATVGVALVSASAGGSLRSQKKYQSYCASCHGSDGKGNGTAASGLNPPPANLANCAKMKMRTDEFIYEVIAKGGSAEGLSSAMPEWSAAFKDRQIHGLVEYSRSFCK
ncbi:MAG TPA: c-type cytochrome [Candidatus Binataceae bacterium]|nr:c-type cytochrome [Candidatus Binataceae bacterium]